MRIKKFIAPSMKEALAEIKQELGEDAIILKTQRLPRKMLSLSSRPEIEVTAAVDDQKTPTRQFQPLRMTSPGVYRPPRPGNSTAIPGTDRANRIRKKEDHGQGDSATSAQPGGETPKPDAIERIQDDIRELKRCVFGVVQTGHTTPEARTDAETRRGIQSTLYKRLIESEVSPRVAQRLINGTSRGRTLSDNGMKDVFIASVKELVAVSGPIRLHPDRPTVVAFVGPTGSGKTTTIAKLAAHYTLSRKKAVSIITTDTYRIAAIEQIRTFSEIMGIGLQILFDPADAHDVLSACDNDDIVFVDTPGRSWRDEESMARLTAVLRSLRPDEIHCVVSATTKDSDLTTILARYRPLGVNRLLFSKLDETSKIGNIINTVCSGSIPLSYFTLGQNVPDDIEIARPGQCIRRLWKVPSHG